MKFIFANILARIQVFIGILHSTDMKLLYGTMMKV